MKTVGFFGKLTLITMGRLCRQRWLLAGLAFLCLVLPLLLGPAAEKLITEGVEFSKISFAVTAPEGDALPELLEKYMGRMRDISEYCSFSAMSRGGAEEALENGEVTAILNLPEDFVRGVMDGTNPDVELIVPGDRPVQSILTLWVGQSAADLLSAVQAGIYAVLEQYEQISGEGKDFSQVVTEINLRYVNWTMGRGELFSARRISATGSLPIDKHYALSLLAYFALSVAPFFTPVYDSRRLAFCRRMMAVGRGTLLPCLADLAACALITAVLVLLPLLFICGLGADVFAAAMIMGLSCAAFGSFCCLICKESRSCALLSLAVSSVSLLVSGGLLPLALLPAGVRGLAAFSPVGWLRELAAFCLEGHETEPGALLALLICTMLLCLLTALLYRRRALRGEAEL